VTMSSFNELYAALANLTEQDAPDLDVNEDGSAGFSMTVSGLPVLAIHLPNGSVNSNTAFFFMDLGKMPEEIELAGWQALMQANFDFLNDGAPCFSRRPTTGEVLLQYAYPMDRGDRATLLGNLLGMARIGCQWRAEHFLHSEPDALTQA
jgi:hypothetical protein